MFSVDLKECSVSTTGAFLFFLLRPYHSNPGDHTVCYSCAILLNSFVVWWMKPPTDKGYNKQRHPFIVNHKEILLNWSDFFMLFMVVMYLWEKIGRRALEQGRKLIMISFCYVYATNSRHKTYTQAIKGNEPIIRSPFNYIKCIE